MAGEIVTGIVYSATELLNSLGNVFTAVIGLLFDFETEGVSELGQILLITAGFALAYAGIRFVFGLVSRLTGATRGSAR